MQTSFTAEQLRDPDMAASNTVLRTCVHGGFCTATWATFLLSGDELDSLRGRIYLTRDALEAGRSITEKVVRHIDRCLACLSCMTTCPSGVHYMHLVDHARSYIERTYKRPWHDRLLRAVLGRVLPNPRLFRAALQAACASRPIAGLLPAGHPVSRRPRATLRLGRDLRHPAAGHRGPPAHAQTEQPAWKAPGCGGGWKHRLHSATFRRRVAGYAYGAIAGLDGARARTCQSASAVKLMRYVPFLLLILATPALAQTQPAQQRAEINKLLDGLKAAPSPAAAAALEGQLQSLWVNQGSPAVRLLMGRGVREMEAGNYGQAVQSFDDVVTLDPNLAEGYRQLAMARYAAGDTEGAIEDLAVAVQHEPRDFLAYKSLSEIAAQRGDWKGAYEAWQKLLALDPNTPGGQDKLKELQVKAFGQET